jgi:hypothetical protein
VATTFTDALKARRMGTPHPLPEVVSGRRDGASASLGVRSSRWLVHHNNSVRSSFNTTHLEFLDQTRSPATFSNVPVPASKGIPITAAQRTCAACPAGQSMGAYRSGR